MWHVPRSIPQSVGVGDFNGDGIQDLAVVNDGSDNVSILIGNGLGGFAPPVNFGVGDAPISVAVGDFNGDGKQDLSVANILSDSVSILMNNCVLATPTATNTPTPTAEGTPSISGTVTYGNPASPTVKFISNATVTGTGSPNVSTTTAAPGGRRGSTR